MPSLEASSVIPQEMVSSRRSKGAPHLALSKKLITDVLNTKKLSTTTTCDDATNC